MKRLREILSGSFRMKVLVPVIGVMVLLLVVTAWVVNRRITSQFEVEATRALSAARQGFRDWQQNRARTLSLRFGDLSNEPRYRAAFQTRDTLTVRAQLGELLKSVDQDVRIVLFTTQEEESLASVSRDPLLSTDAFEAACGPVVRMALQGDQKVETLQVGGRLYDVVCLPVLAPGGARMGALSIGVEMGDAAAAELSRFTRSQVVLLSEGQVMLTTFGGEETRGRLPALYRDLTAARAGGRHHVWREFLEGRHYFCAGGRLESVQGDGPIGYLLLYSYEDAWNSLVRTQQWLLAANGLAILFGSIVVSFFVGKVTAPLRVLRDGAEVVGRGDFSHRVRVRSTDECGRLAQEFNRMTENLERSRRELETAHAELVETSRRAGMAEMATGVLHNVGNVLTSVNVASSFIAEGLKKSKAANLPRLVALLKQHEADLGAFLTNDPKGRQVLGYLSQLSDHLGKEQEATLEELAQMQKGIEHIKDIVKSQQSCAKHSGKPECVEVSALVEDALRMSASSKSAVQVVQQLDPDLRVTVEKHKVLQILINLIRNGRQACESAGVAPGLLTIRASNGGSHVRIAISDNGQGIAPENLDRIFKHGFTTKKDGHGFGLHSSIQAARDMGGGLRAESAGPGQGATFILELPSAAGTVAKAEH